MTEQDRTGSQIPAMRAKKPYQKPEVRFERIFETSALVCGKVQTSQQSCSTNRSAS
jgi:hypothetical protein